MSELPSRPDRLRGGVLGLLVGDALGVPYEFHAPATLPERIDFEPPSDFDRAHRGIAPGTYSDDGAQALCLLASLLERRSLDVDDVAQRFLDWYEHGYLAVDGRVFDVGVQTRVAFHALLQGTPPLEAGPTDERRNGNGSLMRCLPLALHERRDDGVLVAAAEDQSRITHGHAQSRVACALYCLWARIELAGTAPSFADSFREAVTRLRAVYRESQNLDSLETLESVFRPDEPWTGKGSGWVVDSLKSVRMIVETVSSYEEGVLHAVRLGDDTDTTAAIAGGLLGLRFGASTIPTAWRDGLRGAEHYEPLIALLLGDRGGVG